MYLGTALVLIAGGLILALAVTADPIPGVDLQMIGWILFIVGVIGAILELAVFRPRRTATYGTTTGVTREREVVRDRDVL
jgi:Domain of unknown function (DUF6458)